MTIPTQQDTADYIVQSGRDIWTVPGLSNNLALRLIKTVGGI